MGGLVPCLTWALWVLWLVIRTPCAFCGYQAINLPTKIYQPSSNEDKIDSGSELSQQMAWQHLLKAAHYPVHLRPSLSLQFLRLPCANSLGGFHTPTWGQIPSYCFSPTVELLFSRAQNPRLSSSAWDGHSTLVITDSLHSPWGCVALIPLALLVDREVPATLLPLGTPWILSALSVVLVGWCQTL